MAASSASTRPGYLFLVCPDSALIMEQVDYLLKSFKPDTGEWQRQIYRGEEEPGRNFWESLGQQGLFATSNAVIVRNAQEWPDNIWKSLSAVLATGHSQVWPMFCIEVGMEKSRFKIPAHIQKSRCMQYAEKQKWIWTQPALAAGALQKYVLAKAKKAGIRFDGEGLEAFCMSVRPDASAINNEIEKLSLAATDGTIGAELIASCSCSAESDAFLLLKKLFANDLAGVWREISLNNASSLLFFLIALLAREFLGCWDFLTGSSSGAVKYFSPARQQTARTMGLSGIASGMAMLADAEFQVKSGRQTPEQVLETLMINISTLVNRRAYN